jgi:hypothetical protein
MKKKNEFRRFQRFQVQVAAVFRWKNGRTRQAGEGVTREISSNGMLVEASVLPPLNTEVAVSLRFPPTGDKRPGLTISAKGRVVRKTMEQKSEKRAFALYVSQAMRVQKQALQKESASY